MKCRVCRQAAIIDLPRHNANFCAEHFSRFVRQQVERAISEHKMFAPDAKLLVAVSGGKDSLALWHILHQLKFDVTGLYIGLGIGNYSDASANYTKAFANRYGLRLVEVDLEKEYGYNIEDGAKAAKRVPCSACGTSKRHIFDTVATQGGFDVLCTGHNLDDEAAVLFGNSMHWQTEYLARQHPVLEQHNGFPRKVKPLIRLDEREMAAYCVLNGIEYIVDECPMAKGNKHLRYKEALNLLEANSPGTKANFVNKFLAHASEIFKDYYRRTAISESQSPEQKEEGEEKVAGEQKAEIARSLSTESSAKQVCEHSEVGSQSIEATPSSKPELSRCSHCNSVTTAGVCAFCRLVSKATNQKVELTPKPKLI